MNPKKYFAGSFVLGMVLGNVAISTFGTPQVQADSVIAEPTKTETVAPIEKQVEDAVIASSYLMMMVGGVLVFQKVRSQRQHLTPGSKMRWQSI